MTSTPQPTATPYTLAGFDKRRTDFVTDLNKNTGMDEAEFRRRWTGPGRLWVVADKDEVKELFADPTFRHPLLVESRGNYLFSNQP